MPHGDLQQFAPCVLSRRGRGRGFERPSSRRVARLHTGPHIERRERPNIDDRRLARDFERVKELVSKRRHLRELRPPACDLDHQVPVAAGRRHQRDLSLEIELREHTGADVHRHIERFELLDQIANHR